MARRGGGLLMMGEEPEQLGFRALFTIAANCPLLEVSAQAGDGGAAAGEREREGGREERKGELRQEGCAGPPRLQRAGGDCKWPPYPALYSHILINPFNPKGCLSDPLQGWGAENIPGVFYFHLFCCISSIT